ncbi:MAG TPA: hypothetical protein VJJ98_02285 [Sedimentisphaerales bacterium]|nr:hypothetical protein [Sedimentisphaerales bacterium]
MTNGNNYGPASPSPPKIHLQTRRAPPAGSAAGQSLIYAGSSGRIRIVYELSTILARAGDDVNKSPYAKYFMIVIMLIGGPILIFNGIRGVKNRRTTVTRRCRGKQLTGSQAVLAGWVQIGIGALFTIVALLTLVFR